MVNRPTPDQDYIAECVLSFLPKRTLDPFIMPSTDDQPARILVRLEDSTQVWTLTVAGPFDGHDPDQIAALAQVCGLTREATDHYTPEVEG